MQEADSHTVVRAILPGLANIPEDAINSQEATDINKARQVFRAVLIFMNIGAASTAQLYSLMLFCTPPLLAFSIDTVHSGFHGRSALETA